MDTMLEKYFITSISTLTVLTEPILKMDIQGTTQRVNMFWNIFFLGNVV
jgi:hypothetical protein